MDEVLGLGPEAYSPELVRLIARQGSRDSFGEAREELRVHQGLDISPSQVQAITERVGREWAAQRDRDVEAFKKGELGRWHGEAPQVAAVMVDGGRVQTREEGAPQGVQGAQWKEDKVGCCLTLASHVAPTDPQPTPPNAFLDAERVPRLVQEVQHRMAVPRERAKGAEPRGTRKLGKKKRPPRVRVLLRSAVASMQSAQEFGYMLASEAYRRGLDRASRKAFLGDGQAYNWTIHEEHFQEWGFIPVLDFLHLLTYLYPAAYAAGGAPPAQWARYRQWLTWAWSGAREKLWAALQESAAVVGKPPKGAPEKDPRVVLADACRYVTNNIEKMDYPRYRKLGLPISSAPVESLIKQFNRRLKGTEKFWTPQGAEGVLQVRAAYLSQDDRVDRFWAAPRPRYRAVGRNRLALAG